MEAKGLSLNGVFERRVASFVLGQQEKEVPQLVNGDGEGFDFIESLLDAGTVVFVGDVLHLIELRGLFTVLSVGLCVECHLQGNSPTTVTLLPYLFTVSVAE